MTTNDEAPGIHLVKAIIPDYEVAGRPVSTFYVAASGTADQALAAVRAVVPQGWEVEVSENRLSLATVRRLGLRAGEVRQL